MHFVNPPSLTERLFWPAVVFATLALGGFGYFAATKMFRSVPAQLAYAPLDHVTHTESKPAPVPAAAVPVETPAVEVAVQTAAPSAADAAPETAEAPAAPATPGKMEPDDPYMVPDHKPFIDQSTFAKKAPPKPVAPPKKPLPKTAPTAVASAPAIPNLKPQTPVVMATPMPKVPSSSDIKVPEIPAPQHPTYVMNDGRRILAVKVVDLGEFWGLKTIAGQIVSVRKDDVKEVAR